MKKEKILIVDDEQDFVMTVKYFLESKGYEVVAACDGNEGLSKAKEKPDIILLDLSLPGMNGFDVLNKLKMSSVTSEIPVVILTVSSNIKSIIDAESLGAVDYIVKSESLDSILMDIKKYTRLGKKEKDFLEEEQKPRGSGISALDDIAWGSHICAFYSSKDDLLGMLLPYFRVGLLNNELCIWALSEGISIESAKAALSREIDNVDGYIEKGQLKIIDGSSIYADSGRFDRDKVINFWIEEEQSALELGYDGIRITGSGNWAYGPKWRVLIDYEKAADSVIVTKKIIALCSYSFSKFGMLEIMSIGTHHTAIIAKQGDRSVNFIPMSDDTFFEYFDINGRGIKE